MSLIRSLRLPVGLSGSAALVAGSVLLLAGPAQAAVCDDDDGVSVVVQFPDGRTESGCAPGDPASGLAALSGAGFGYAFEARNPGFVCKIKGSPGDGRCLKPKYWSYWHSSGGRWSYSTEGAATYDPAPGSTEGWRFGDDATAPGQAASNPPPAPAPAPSKKPGKAVTRTPVTQSQAPSAPSTSASASAGTTPSATPSTTPSATSTGPSASASSGAVAGDDTSAVSAPTAAEDDPAPSGTLSWPWAVGLLGVVAVMAAVATLVRRRTG